MLKRLKRKIKERIKKTFRSKKVAKNFWLVFNAHLHLNKKLKTG